MAFLSKVGNILKQTASRKFNSELGFTSSIYHSVRCMSSYPSTKLFIGGLSFSTDESSLSQELAKYGEILDARIIHDRETGRSRGFGFVTFTNAEEASSAIQALDGKELHGRLVRVNYANDRPRTFGGGYNNAQYGGGGGFSGGYGNAPYGGTGGGSGFSGGYGNAPYGVGDRNGDGGAGGGYDGGFNSGSNYTGPAAGGNHASEGDYNTKNYGGNNYGMGGTGGSYGGSGAIYGNDGNFCGAGGSDNNLGNDGGLGGCNNYGNYRSTSVGYVANEAGAGNNFATGGYDGNSRPGYGVDQFGSNFNHAEDAHSLGTCGEDSSEKGDFANRA